MELNSKEQILWDNFRDVLIKHVNEEIERIPNDANPTHTHMLIESSIDLLTELHSRLPYDGIPFERSNVIIRGVTLIMKKKLNEIFYN